MERYICITCGRYCYTSVTTLSNHITGDACPYEDCNGHCVPAPVYRNEGYCYISKEAVSHEVRQGQTRRENG